MHTLALCSRCPHGVPCGDAHTQHTFVVLRPLVADGGLSPAALFGLVDGEVTTIDIAAVERVDRFGSLVGGSHLDEPEAAGAAGVTIVDDLSLGDLAVLREELLEIGRGSVEREITHVDVAGHCCSLAI
jgi:hypothetical protein